MWVIFYIQYIHRFIENIPDTPMENIINTYAERTDSSTSLICIKILNKDYLMVYIRLEYVANQWFQRLPIITVYGELMDCYCRSDSFWMTSYTFWSLFQLSNGCWEVIYTRHKLQHIANCCWPFLNKNKVERQIAVSFMPENQTKACSTLQFYKRWTHRRAPIPDYCCRISCSYRACLDPSYMALNIGSDAIAWEKCYFTHIQFRKN